MNAPIVLFIVIGALFGLMTFSRRHLFSEGGTRAGDPARARGLDGRAVWVATCCALWPLMVVSGSFGWWRRRAAAIPKDDSRRITR